VSVATELNPAILAHAVELRAGTTPEHPVLTFESPERVEAVTYARLLGGAEALALALAEAGVGRGTRFAVMMRNHPEFAYALTAASLAGTVLVPLDPRMRGEKLRYMVEHSRARAIVCTHDLVPVLGEALAAGAPRPLLVARTPPGAPLPAGATDLAAVLAAPPRARGGQQVTDPRTPWQIMYTSGTTGDPKGVVCENARFGLYALLGRVIFNYADDEVLYTGLSLTHGNAQAVTFANAVAHGLRAVISERFTRSRLWDVCRRHGCTTFSLLGGMATAIYAEPPRPDDADNPVRFVVSAGMPRALWEDFERRFAVRILEWYGAVDGGVAFKPIGTGPVGSFGKPIPGMEMRVVDEHDRECPPGVVGELVCRNVAGPTVVEYLDDAEASRAKTRGGWIRTGDMCHRDADGWLFFDWRKGGGLRHNGDFVLPDYVARAAIECAGVADVACYGVPARSGAPGEVDVVLALVPAPGTTLDPAAIFRHLATRLEPNFVPSYLQLVPEIPKTISEKPQTRLLAEAFAPTAPNVHTRDAALPREVSAHGA
jgi:crotonobetaine/carnitine-CoA ligase